MDIHKLLYLLSDGQFHSGSELGALLGISRTSVWKSLPVLQDFSIEVEVVKGKGYRILGGLDLLDKNKISSLLSSFVKSHLEIDLILSHASTNDYLVDQLKGRYLSGYHACLAEVQLSGRGRRGRTWISPFAKNIYLSLGFSIGGGVDQISGLSLVVGLAVAKALNALGIDGVGLKWPNDVMIDGKKIAGILLELSGEATTGWNVICGVGLNVGMTEKDGEVIDQPWVALNNYMPCSRNTIAAKLVGQLISELEKFQKGTFSDFIKEWDGYDILRGKEIQVSPGGLVGKAMGINSQGALLIKNSEKECIVSAGEVSVRRV